MKTTLSTSFKNSRLHLFLQRLNNIYLILLFVLASYMISVFFAFLSRFISNHPLSFGFPKFIDVKDHIISALIVAPLLETLIFQYGIIESFRAKKSLTTCCLISALAFASLHVYNVYYFFTAFFGGLFLAYLYVLKRNSLAGFILTSLAHFSFNALAFLIKMAQT